MAPGVSEVRSMRPALRRAALRRLLLRAGLGVALVLATLSFLAPTGWLSINLLGFRVGLLGVAVLLGITSVALSWSQRRRPRVTAPRSAMA